MSVHQIRGCSLDSETGGLVLEYLTLTSDVRTNGMVLNHALLIPPEDAFASLLEEVEQTLQRTLRAALQAFEEAGALDLADPDDTASPYDNPTER